MRLLFFLIFCVWCVEAKLYITQRNNIDTPYQDIYRVLNVEYIVVDIDLTPENPDYLAIHDHIIIPDIIMGRCKLISECHEQLSNIGFHQENNLFTIFVPKNHTAAQLITLLNGSPWHWLDFYTITEASF